MVEEITNWLWDLVVKLFGALWSFIKDIAVEIFDLLVSAFVVLVAAIPVPDWMSSGLGSFWGGMDSGVVYLVSQAGVPEALALIGGGYAFRFARKVVTLFQW